MGFFDRNKALIITLLLFSITVLAMVNVKLSNSSKEIATTLIDLENFRETEPEEKQEEANEIPEPTPAPERTSVQTHQAYNQNQEQVQDIDSRLKEIFEQNSSESEASEEESTSTSSGEIGLAQNTQNERRERSEGNNSSEKTSTRTGSIENSSIAFSLVGRTAFDIPNPIYTCDTSGKIVVNITVNAEGTVTSTDINKASSTSTNECLTKKAQEYAKGAVFSNLPGRDSQIGTITYYFQG